MPKFKVFRLGLCVNIKGHLEAKKYLQAKILMKSVRRFMKQFKKIQGYVLWLRKLFIPETQETKTSLKSWNLICKGRSWKTLQTV